MFQGNIFEKERPKSCSCCATERCLNAKMPKTITSSLSGFCLSAVATGPSVGFAMKYFGYSSAAALSGGFTAALTGGCFAGLLCCCVCTCCPCQCRKSELTETSGLLKGFSMSKD